MPRVDVQLAAILIFLTSTMSSDAQAPSRQCDQRSRSCSPSPQPKLADALHPPTLEPPRQLTVTYDGKLLSVQGHGASLRSVLAVIGGRTGTEIEFRGGSDPGGVYADLGPATVRDLLRDLLNGSQLNYVMLESGSDPGFVERLVISGDAHGSANTDYPPPAVVANRQPVPPAVYGAGFAPDPEEGDSTLSVSAPAEPEPVPAAVAVQPSAAQSSVDPSMVKYQQQYQQAMADAASSGKSQAQILDELQKLQQKDLDEQYTQSQPH